MKKWIVRILLIALTLAVVNDFGWYLKAMYTLDHYGRDAIFQAGAIARENAAPNSGWAVAWQVGHDHGIEFLSYQQNSSGVVAVGTIDVYGTFIIGPVNALLTRQPISTPFALQQTFHSTAQ